MNDFFVIYNKQSDVKPQQQHVIVIVFLEKRK